MITVMLTNTIQYFTVHKVWFNNRSTTCTYQKWNIV